MNKRNNQDIHLDPSRTFEAAGLHPYLVRLYQALPYQHPTPVQFHSLETYLQQKTASLIVQSKSGTGKTLAYLTLLLTHILTRSQHSQPHKQCRYVVMTPTRELALQVHHHLKNIIDTVTKVKGEGAEEVEGRKRLLGMRALLGIGGIPFEDDRKGYLEKGGDVLVGTIGRVMEWFGKGLVRVEQLEMVVLDEGDKLVESKTKGFKQWLWKVISSKQIQSLVYSATYSAKVVHQLTKVRQYVLIQTLAEKDKLRVNVTPNLHQFIFDCASDKTSPTKEEQAQQGKNQEGLIDLANIKKYKLPALSQNSAPLSAKTDQLLGLLRELTYRRCLVFVDKKTLLQTIQQRLIAGGLDPLLIHGSLSQSARIRLMNEINHSKLVLASDLLARGIDLQVDLVVLFDAKQGETFWHRIGRTGRFGRTGVVVSLEDIQGWIQYAKEEVQQELDRVELNQRVQEKEVYGGHMSEIGQWTEVKPEQQIQMEQYYKYAEGRKRHKKDTHHHNLIQVESQDNEHTQLDQQIWLEQFAAIKTVSQLKSHLQPLRNCHHCQQLMIQVTQLTGYDFKLAPYIFDE